MRVATFVIICCLGTASVASAALGEIVYMQREAVEVYEAPSNSAPVKVRLKRGQKAMEFERQGSWVRIGMFDTSGSDGWVRTTDVAVRPPGEDIAAPDSKPEERRTPVDEPKPKVQHAASAPLVIHVSGTAHLGYQGFCDIVTETGDRLRSKFSGRLTTLRGKSYEVAAKAGSCGVRISDRRVAPGRLRVKLSKGRDIIGSIETRKVSGWVYIRTHGPWGKARALSCSSGGRKRGRCLRVTLE